MPERTILLPSRLLTPEDWGRTGLVLEDGMITGLLFTDPPRDARVVDLTGFTLVPGFIDLHVHFREPGEEYKETIRSGAMSAAAGGFTTVCCMPNTDPAIDDPAVLELIRERAEAACGVRVLVNAGACLTTKDRIWQGTPRDWAEHAGYGEIAAYLKEQEKAR